MARSRRHRMNRSIARFVQYVWRERTLQSRRGLLRFARNDGRSTRDVSLRGVQRRSNLLATWIMRRNRNRVAPQSPVTETAGRFMAGGGGRAGWCFVLTRVRGRLLI